MSTIRKITLTQFRNYEQASFELPHTLTCITGPNGAGKTNLLDAVYYLCYTKSYFTAYQQHCMQHDAEGFRVEGIFDKGEMSETISCIWRNGKKEIQSNGIAYDQAADHIGKYAAVIIAPDDMELINGRSAVRRKWMDSILGQVDSKYLLYLMAAQQVLQQRNAWLKRNISYADATLDYYDRCLSTYGSYLHEQRKAFMASFLPLLAQYYHHLSGGRETITISYQSDLHQQSMEQWLHNTLQQDLQLQRTTRGIHRDDLDIHTDGISLRNFGSQGQKKTGLFALKLAQYAFLKQTLQHAPILLLDDVFEKLDEQRMDALLRLVKEDEFGQVILTDTHQERVQQVFHDYDAMGYISI